MVSFQSYIFKRKNQAITLGLKSLVKIDGITLQFDPQLLLTLVAKATRDFEAVFKVAATLRKQLICQTLSSLILIFNVDGVHNLGRLST